MTYDFYKNDPGSSTYTIDLRIAGLELTTEIDSNKLDQTLQELEALGFRFDAEV